MTEKQELIAKMIDMQSKFTQYERAHGVDPQDYFAPGPDHVLQGYRQAYDELAKRLIDLAHAEKGSKR